MHCVAVFVTDVDYRKKAQQSWAREQVKEARAEGKDVDGGAGASGRQPRVEID
jgi:hypothetical protein